MLSCNKTDIFPRDLSTTVQQLAYPEKNFKFFANDDVKIFVMHCNSDFKMYYYKRAWSDKFEQHMRNIGKESQHFREFEPNRINWSSVATKFRRPVVESHRANADTRVGFKCGDKFLVKTYFTFGQRTVQRGTVHIIQTLNVPLLFFLLEKKLYRKVKVEDGFFPHNDIHFYDRRILMPNGCFRIPPGTTYFIFSTQKNFFSLNINDENDVISIPYTDPVKTRVSKLEGIYDIPMKTPYIEDEERDYNQTSNPALYQLFRDIQQPVKPAMPSTVEHVFQKPMLPIFKPPVDEQPIYHSFVEPVDEQPIYHPPQPLVDEQPIYHTLQPSISPDLPKAFEEPMETFQQPMETFQPRIEFLIPSILEKNVIVASQDFVENFQKLRWKPLDAPTQFSPDNSYDVQPMDLSTKINVIDLDAEMDSEKLDEIMNDLYSAVGI